MGDHICGGAGANAGAGAAPASAAAAATGGGGLAMANLLPTAKSIQERLGGVVDTFLPVGKSVHDKIGAIPPVDTAIASKFITVSSCQAIDPIDADVLHVDRSYSRQPLTPLSLSSGSRSVSPRTPGARPSIGRADDYFSPGIESNDGQNYAQSTQSGGYGGFGDVDRDQPYPGSSPKKSGLSLFTRIDSIAAGPYADENFSPPPMPSMRNEPTARRPTRPSEDRGRMGPSAIAPPRMPRKNGYGGFGPPGQNDEPDFTSPNRAETFPTQMNERLEPPLRAPSAPGPRPDRLRDTSRPPPPRTSLVKVRTKNPSINLDAEFGSNNPYHSPSPSIASSLSRGSSQVSQPSSSTSPARSATSARRPFDNSPSRGSPPSPFESLLNDVQTSMEDMRPKGMPPTPDLDEKVARQKRLPPSDRYDPAIQGGRPPSPPPSTWDENSRQDPAIQGGSGSGRQNNLPPSPMDSTAPASRREPAPQKSRGDCRACGLAITGKSISSADGRLSGRYHKACFVCTSCYEPFPTAEFYVHGDRPYCKRHYHKINGSLCGTCKEGIEGQYLEDESTTKYHFQCFRCGDCQRVLRDGYFEVNGNAYCEKDAWRRLQSTRRSPSMSSQRSYGRSPLAPPGGRSGMRPPPGAGPPPQSGMPGYGRMGPPMSRGPEMGLAPPMPKMEKRMTRVGMMGGF